MKSIGSYIAIAGILSSLLSLINFNLRILMWIDSWGATTGWIIRGGLIVVGAALYFMGGSDAEEEEETE